MSSGIDLSYKKGASFERKVRRALENEGYFVIRAAASKPVDLVAIRDGKTVLVECKSGSSRISKFRAMELLKLSRELKVDVLLAYEAEGGKVLIEPLEKVVDVS